MIMFFIVLISGLTLSAVAAWYSIAGLMAVFAAAQLPVMLMGGALEIGKVVAVSWLYRNWNTMPNFLRRSLCAAVAGLMIITSIGIYGFLSKAHIEQTLQANSGKIDVALFEQQYDYQQSIIDNNVRVLKQLDSSVETLITAQRIRGADGAIAVREQQTIERTKLTDQIDAARKKQIDIRKEQQVIEKQQLQLKAEVGPIRYVAELIFDSATDEQLERAVRVLIIAIIFIFDPLAILLLIAANIEHQKAKVRMTRTKKYNQKKQQTVSEESNAVLFDGQNLASTDVVVTKKRKA